MSDTQIQHDWDKTLEERKQAREQTTYRILILAGCVVVLTFLVGIGVLIWQGDEPSPYPPQYHAPPCAAPTQVQAGETVTITCSDGSTNAVVHSMK